MKDTIVAPITAPGTAAVAVVRLSGDRAREIAQSAFSARLKNRVSVYGALLDEEGRVLDRALCVLFEGPGSYTGEDVVELSLHGSPLLVREAVALFCARGARLAGRGEFTRRAFLNGKLDLTAAEGVMEVIDAATPAELRAAASHLGGRTFSELSELRAALLSVSARLCAFVDYPDDDIGDYPSSELSADLAALWERARNLTERARRGEALHRGMRAVLCGKPNAGKSSLLNALLRRDRAIVTDLPGTTRDVVSETLVLGNAKIELCDTAGLRPTDDPIERIGVEKSRELIERSPLLLALFDTSRPLDREDEALLSLLDPARTVALLTKCDLPCVVNKEYISSRFRQTVELSLPEERGLRELEAILEERATGGEAPDESLIFSMRQGECLRRLERALSEALRAARAGVTYDAVTVLIDEAAGAICELTGEAVSERVVDTIFEQFCVGK